MFLSLFATLALGAAAPVAQPAALVTCNPQGKVIGCVASNIRPSQGQTVELAANGGSVERTIACHPDPSRNRGCFRPAPGAEAKATMARAKVKPAAATAQADPATASQGVSDRKAS